MPWAGGGVGVGKKITDNHDTDKGLADPDLLAVFSFTLSRIDQLITGICILNLREWLKSP